MKRLLFIFVAVAFIMVTCVGGLSFGQEQMPTEKDMEMQKCPMMEGGMKGSMCPMMGKKMMGERKVVATQDGGVVVLIANRLMKYDKNLNLVKEAKIDMDSIIEDCKNMMMKHCPIADVKE